MILNGRAAGGGGPYRKGRPSGRELPKRRMNKIEERFFV
jgi:hypothetical protein